MLPATILSLLLAMVSIQQLYPNDVHLLIKQLNDFYQFDHHIFLMDSATNLNRWFSMLTTDTFTPQTVYTFPAIHHKPQNVTAGKNTFLVVVTEDLTSEKRSQVFDQIQAISNLDKNVRIGVFLARDITSLSRVKKLLRWSWNAGIVNIFCAFNFGLADSDPTFNVFKYDPFGAFDLVNLTGSEYLVEYFPDKRPNYREHPIRFQVVDDLSDYFTHVQFWETVCRAFNASMLKMYIPYEQYRAGERDVVDIYHHEQIVYDTKLVQMYPYRQEFLVLTVPHAHRYSDVAMYLQSGTWTMLFVIAFIVIVTSSLLLIVSSYIQRRKIVTLQCVADVVNLLVNDNAGIRYQNLHRADIFIVVPLTFAGLIVMNGIVSLFQSFITSPIYEPQINTLEALYKSSVPIVELDPVWANEFVAILTGITKYNNWRDKMYLTTFINNVNTSNRAYPITAKFQFKGDAQAFLEVQKRLSLEWYHMISDTFLARYLFAFKTSPEYPFIDHINGILHALNSGGISSKWEKYAEERYVEKLYKEDYDLQFYHDNESDVRKFAVPTVVWIGWIASTIVFISEIIWNRVTLSYKSYKIRKWRISSVDDVTLQH